MRLVYKGPIPADDHGGEQEHGGISAWVVLVEPVDPRTVHMPRSHRRGKVDLHVFGPFDSERAANAAKRDLCNGWAVSRATVKAVWDLDYLRRVGTPEED